MNIVPNNSRPLSSDGRGNERHVCRAQRHANSLLRGQRAQGAHIEFVNPLIVANAERIAAESLRSRPLLFSERRAAAARHRLLSLTQGLFHPRRELGLVRSGRVAVA